MSGSHFGSGFWPDDFFGLYFQPEAGGVIVGTLAGSFSGSASFTGKLAAPSLLRGRLRGRRRWLSSGALEQRERDLEALRKKTLEAVRRKEVALGNGPLSELFGKDIDEGAALLDMPRPFAADNFERLQRLVELTQKIDMALALVRAREDEEDEEILLLAA